MMRLYYLDGTLTENERTQSSRLISMYGSELCHDFIIVAYTT